MACAGGFLTLRSPLLKLDTCLLYSQAEDEIAAV